MTVALVKEFFDDFIAGKMQPYRRVQPEPIYNDGVVKILTASTADDFLWKDGYDKFVYLWRNDDNGNGVRPIFWEICEEYMAANPKLKD
jgi:hypothetical protein